jgi:hypothetical protein
MNRSILVKGFRGWARVRFGLEKPRFFEKPGFLVYERQGRPLTSHSRVYPPRGYR